MKEYKVEVYEDKTEWYNLVGQLHREDGPAVEYTNGHKEWYQIGKKHRLDGPAIEWIDGSKLWFQNGQLHRENGPAIEYTSGNKFWFINGQQLSEEEFKQRINSCTGKIVEIDGKKYKLTEL